MTTPVNSSNLLLNFGTPGVIVKHVYIKSNHSGMFLTANCDKKIVQMPFDKDSDQMWEIQYDPIKKAARIALHACADYVLSEQKIYAYVAPANICDKTQDWTLKDGILINGKNRALDVTGWSTREGQHICTWHNIHKGANQQWTLIQAQEPVRRYLDGADFDLEKKIDRAISDNFLKSSERISTLMSDQQAKKHTSVIHMPDYINWKHCNELGYEILHVDRVCWLEFSTEMNLPKSENLELYFKMKIGAAENDLCQNRTPEISVFAGDCVISKGFIDPKDMAVCGSWHWVKVCTDKNFQKPMTFSTAKARQYKIHWLSEKKTWYKNISFGGLTVVAA